MASIPKTDVQLAAAQASGMHRAMRTVSDYDSLPMGMKQKYSAQQWMWLLEDGRRAALEQETMPEPTED